MKSQDKATAVWKEIKPFAIRDISGMLEQAKSSSQEDGYFIILYDASAAVQREYSFSADGLDAAIAAAASGDVVWIPAGSLASDITVPSGVTVVGMGMNCIIAGTVILGSGAELRDLAVEANDNSESEIIGVIGPDSGTAYIRDCVIGAYNCGNGDAIGIDAQAGDLDVIDSYVNGESVGGDGYGVRQS